MRRTAPSARARKHCGVLVFALAAVGGSGCSSHDKTVTPVDPTRPIAHALQQAEAAPPAPPPPPVEGYPHASEITHLAVTESGDAAVSSDALDSVRLWPRLDGTQVAIPVPVATSVEQLALLRDQSDFVVVVRDTAGSIQLVRIGADGHVRARTQLGQRTLASDRSAFSFVVAVGDGVLASTTDHALEAYGLDGALRGRLMAEPGERIAALASRRGRGAVLVTSRDGARVRWVRVQAGLSWGMTSAPLPVTPVDGVLAIAPTASRVAVMDAKKTNSLRVYDGNDLTDLTVKERRALRNVTSLGFIDDDTVGIGVTSGYQWWRAPDAKGPEPRVQGDGVGSGFAVAEGTLVLGRSHELALVTPDRVRYLGWNQLANGAVSIAGNGVALNYGSTAFAWLDTALHETGRFTLQPITSSGWAYGIPLGENHVLVQRQNNTNTGAIDIIDRGKPGTPLTLIRGSDISQYIVQTNMIGVLANGSLHRYRVDLEAMHSEELLPSIRVGSRSFSFLQTFDPARANGVVAVTLGWEHDTDDHMTLTTYRVDGTGKKLLTDRRRGFDKAIAAALPDGTLVVLQRDTDELAIQYQRDGQLVREIKHASSVYAPLALEPDGKRVAFREDDKISVVEADGTERWSRSIWGMNSAHFVGDTLVVVVAGGIIALDAATGEQKARACGFDFGLHDTPSLQPAFSVTPVCEDPIVP